MLPPLDQAEIGLFSFFASAHPTDTCGTNGLPITPNSIKMCGRFQELKVLSHPSLCQYIDIIRGKHERLVIVSEHYPKNVNTLLESGQLANVFDVQRIAHSIMIGLDFLHCHGYIHRSLAPSNILIDKENHVKLSKYGLYHVTNYSADVMFPIGDVCYMAPEVILTGLGYNPDFAHSGPSVDVWSLGMILLDCYLEGKLWGKIRKSVEKISMVLLNLISFRDNTHALEEIIKVSGCTTKYKEMDKTFHSFLRTCLIANPMKRPSVHDLFAHDFIKSIHDHRSHNRSKCHQFPAVFRSAHLVLPDYNKLLLESNTAEDEDHLAGRPICEVYHLWGLAGGDVFNELKKHNQLNSKPPALTLPLTILNNRGELGSVDDDSFVFNQHTVAISLGQLRKRLEHIDATAYYPLVVEDDLCPVDTSETAKLPLVIREKDVEYQFHRIILFERLLEGYPYTRDRIVKEARIDIPPYVRGKVWTALLNITGDIFDEYDKIDKESLTMTDRQIEVDIPRCHQYNYLLSSPTGHQKLKRVLKAWVLSHPNLVYWQGLDSLCAPFLFLHFNNEALAYSCLSAFIPKYLYNFFLKDNSQIIHEYLAVFKQLIAFHEPDLYNHLEEIEFQPELYAIPWFLTMFSHVFPLHKIFHLWDTLLLGNSMLPLCIGVSILQQFKEQLLSFGFNDCILLFSDMPGIDIERCVKDAIKVFNHTPPSATLRKQDNPENRIKAPAEEQFMNLPEKEFLTLNQLRSETCVRISPRDLVRISQLIRQTDSYPMLSRDSNSKLDQKDSKKKQKNNRSKAIDSSLNKLLVIDTRNSDDYAAGHLAYSVNVPFKHAVSETREWISSPVTAVIEAHKGRMVMVMGAKGPEPMQFAQLLVSLGYRRVCVMDGSINILKGLGYLNATQN